MICPKCKKEASGNFCSNCGAPLLKIDIASEWEEMELEDWERLLAKKDGEPEKESREEKNERGASQEENWERRTEQNGPEKRGSREGKEKTAEKKQDGREERKELRAKKQEQEKQQKERELLEKRLQMLEQERAQRQEEKETEEKEKLRAQAQKKREEKREEQKKREERKAEKKEERRREREEKRNEEERQWEAGRGGRREELTGAKRSWEEERPGETAAYGRREHGAAGGGMKEQEAGERRGRDGAAGVKGEGEKAKGPERGDRGEREMTAAKLAEKGVEGVIVLLARVMQISCFLLMAGMVWAHGRALWYGRDGLGSIRAMAAEENYGLALYLGFGALSLLLGLVWCLWILSGRTAGGGLRLKKYDTGRGFIPFLLCACVVFAAGPASMLLSAAAAAGMDWHGLEAGARASLEAVNANHDFLVFCSVAGAVLSLIRKFLRV